MLICDEETNGVASPVGGSGTAESVPGFDFVVCVLFLDLAVSVPGFDFVGCVTVLDLAISVPGFDFVGCDLTLDFATSVLVLDFVAVLSLDFVVTMPELGLTISMFALGLAATGFAFTDTDPTSHGCILQKY